VLLGPHRCRIDGFYREAGEFAGSNWGCCIGGPGVRAGGVSPIADERSAAGTPVLFLCLIVILPAAAVASMHLKAILFFPIAALATWRLASNIFLRAFGLLLLFLIALSTYPYWTARLACPEYPALNQLFGQAVPPSLLWTHPSQFIAEFATNLWQFPRYWSNILFQDRYISDWLPGSVASLVSELANASIRLVFCLIFMTWVCAAYYIAWRAARYKQITHASLTVATLSCCLVLVAGISIPKIFH
jgi:hypothetical protein